MSVFICYVILVLNRFVCWFIHWNSLDHKHERQYLSYTNAFFFLSKSYLRPLYLICKGNIWSHQWCMPYNMVFTQQYYSTILDVMHKKANRHIFSVTVQWLYGLSSDFSPKKVPKHSAYFWSEFIQAAHSAPSVTNSNECLWLGPCIRQ